MGAFFVRDTSNIAWLTAFDGVFDDEDAHALLVTPSDAVLHTDSRYSEAARAAAAREGAVAVDDARVAHAKFVAETFAARHADRPSRPKPSRSASRTPCRSPAFAPSKPPSRRFPSVRNCEKRLTSS